MSHKLNTYRDGYHEVTYCEMCGSEDQAVLYGQPCSGKPVDNKVSPESDDTTVDKKEN